jgi:succinate-semialdehyde dehydrogenase/glutarate-semialdehyde dehydrogenase
MQAINPATEEVVGEYLNHTEQDIRRILATSKEAWRGWRSTDIETRAALMTNAGTLLRQRRASLSQLITQEMGKPIVQSEAEIDKCADGCDHFATHAAEYLANTDIASDAQRSYVRCDPLGGVLAIMPWNFPFWQVFRFAAPALMAGNVGLLKHAPNVPGCAIAIEAIFRDAGFPPGVFASLLIEADAVKAVIEDSAVAAVTLTGSGRAGSAVASQAGHALKKTVLELGGSDPFIVLPDIDPRLAARAATSARTLNSGQSCIAAKRFIIVGDAEPFTREMVAAMRELGVGDPTDRKVNVGPLARLDLLESLDSQVRRSIEAGARLRIGGKRVERKGFFYEPTVLDQVNPGQAAFDEETFGPVAALIEARDVDHAIELANQSDFGLGASIWTRDLARAEQMAARIESGSVFINGPVKSDSRLPFGGIKQSGYGRELSREGIREFVNIKTVWLRKPAD